MGSRNRPQLHAAIHQRLRYGNSRHHRRNEGHAACQRGRIVFGANKNIVCVVDSVFANPGISPIPEQRAVLYGVGTAETFLKSLSAGDELTVFLGTDLASAPGLLTDFKEQMGGSDHIILKNGVPADVWDEEHPEHAWVFRRIKPKSILW